MDRVVMKPPFGVGEPIEIDATPEQLTQLMVAGWSQCEAPVTSEEKAKDVHD
jgi:hypothetical protein